MYIYVEEVLYLLIDSEDIDLFPKAHMSYHITHFKTTKNPKRFIFDKNYFTFLPKIFFPLSNFSQFFQNDYEPKSFVQKTFFTSIRKDKDGSFLAF